MNGEKSREIWQQLLSLESREIVQRRFAQIHSRQLSTRRAREINAAARQAREFFANAKKSDYSVRPFLSYYGVTALSKALLLLMRANGGEEGLTPSHGIETVGWKSKMSGDTAEGLKRLSELSIRKRKGLFADFLRETENTTCIHLRSAAVNWRIGYHIPSGGEEISIADLFSRIPDLQTDFSNVSEAKRYAGINELTYTENEGFRAKVKADAFAPLASGYEKLGYQVRPRDEWTEVTCTSATFNAQPALFVHSYMKKMFGSIPILCIAEPFGDGARYSQLCITYLVSYVLGMLVRYYPTHWLALTQGGSGDRFWPTLISAQQLVDYTYPELIAEFVRDSIDNAG